MITEYAIKPNVSRGTTQPIIQVFRDYISNYRPYCTNDLKSGIYVSSPQIAATRKYIQPNNPNNVKWLVLDLDRPESAFDWEEKHAPTPNFIIVNPKNGHCHYFYGLVTPVHRPPPEKKRKTKTPPKLPKAEPRKKPQEYLAAISLALTLKLEADLRYNGLISKNPLCNCWTILVLRNDLYKLAELAEYVELPKKVDKKRVLEKFNTEPGRNCSLFDGCRPWAYRHIRETKDYTTFFDDCVSYVCNNNVFPKALYLNECYGIAKSIARWTWAHMSPEKRSEWARKQAEKGLVTRRKKADQNLGRAMIAAHEGKHHAEIANELGISLDTVKRMGLERTDPRRAAAIEFKAKHPDASVRTIAAATGIPKSNVARFLGYNNTLQAQRQARKEQAQELANKGRTRKQIAQELGVSEDTVKRMKLTCMG